MSIPHAWGLPSWRQIRLLISRASSLSPRNSINAIFSGHLVALPVDFSPINGNRTQRMKIPAWSLIHLCLPRRRSHWFSQLLSVFNSEISLSHMMPKRQQSAKFSALQKGLQYLQMYQKLHQWLPQNQIWMLSPDIRLQLYGHVSFEMCMVQFMEKWSSKPRGWAQWNAITSLLPTRMWSARAEPHGFSSSIEHKEKGRVNEDQVATSRGCRSKIDSELSPIYDGTFHLQNSWFIPSATSGDSKVLYLKTLIENDGPQSEQFQHASLSSPTPSCRIFS